MTSDQRNNIVTTNTSHIKKSRRTFYNISIYSIQLWISTFFLAVTLAFLGAYLNNPTFVLVGGSTSLICLARYFE